MLPGLYVLEARQWLSTSAGRVAPDGYSWMQGVHWVAGSGLYEPRRHRSHGPRSFGQTTVFIAQLLAELSPCRPGIEYLMRRTGLTKRAVQNHLQILRETGLLAYIVKGTRQRGGPSQASEFALMLPPEFDAALGIRTAGEGTRRRMTGLEESGRKLMAKLAAKAARKVRRPRSATSSGTAPKGARKGASGASVTAVSAGSRCTPMGGSADGSSTAGTTSLPPESKLGSGGSESPIPKKSKAKAGGRRKLNAVGRRFQLARELTQELDWLRGCSVPRIAWVARNVADAGWTVTDVRAWLHFRGEAAHVRRGSGLLAVLLANAVTVLDTPAKRAEAVARWRGAQETARRDRIEQVRAQQERFEGDWQAPSSHAVTHQVAQAFAQVREVANGGRHQDQGPSADDRCEGPGLADPQIDQMREQAHGELMRGVTDLIDLTVDSMGPETAERIYGADLMRRARQLASAARSSLMTITHR
ncbi:helix-turn-helix domain-containing protein [Streptomyces scabiei]|uniref:helix-turn-helix domain-containing protein n=2 Tax=Streptomyces scabiei TaxID=1930 RepID=UPI0029BCB945|nr:helix-turn-helix domain-containing protein [Streptomyces scabiei]MDX2631681.1 helix-turn-helix domain-containing protein [Streptomyces scabiei]